MGVKCESLFYLGNSASNESPFGLLRRLIICLVIQPSFLHCCFTSHEVILQCKIIAKDFAYLIYDIIFCLSLLGNICFKRQFSECQTAYVTTGTLHLQLKSNLSIYHSVTAPKTFPLGLFKIIFRDKYVIKLSGQ